VSSASDESAEVDAPEMSTLDGEYGRDPARQQASAASARVVTARPALR